MHSVGAILFDLDGTLLDTEEQIACAVVETLACFGYTTSPAEIHGIAGRTLRGWLVERFGIAPPEAEAVYQAYLQHTLENFVPLAMPMPYAEALLQRLNKRAIPLAIVTTRELRIAEALLSAVGWMDRFTVVVAQRTAARPKPTPDPAEYALRALGVPPERAVLVGNAEADIVCGAAACVPMLLGVLGERTAETLFTAGATHVCKDLAEVGALLSTL